MGVEALGAVEMEGRAEPVTAGEGVMGCTGEQRMREESGDQAWTQR